MSALEITNFSSKELVNLVSILGDYRLCRELESKQPLLVAVLELGCLSCDSHFLPQCVFSIKPLTPADSPWISGRVTGRALLTGQFTFSYQDPGIQFLLYNHLLCHKSSNLIASGR